eukprot:3941015-Rhodomonas_salina.1
MIVEEVESLVSEEARAEKRRRVGAEGGGSEEGKRQAKESGAAEQVCGGWWGAGELKDRLEGGYKQTPNQVPPPVPIHSHPKKAGGRQRKHR